VPNAPRLAADYISASAFTIDELRAGLRGKSAKVTPALAAGLLSMREYPERVADLCAVLHDPATPLQVRVLVATTVGRLRDPTGTAALRAAASGADPRLRAAIVKALGETMPAPSPTPAEPAPSGSGKAPAVGAAVPAVAIVVREAQPGDLVDLAARQLAEALPSLNLEPAATHAFECRDRRFLLFRVRSFSDGRELTKVKKERAIVAVVASRHEHLAPGFAPRFLIEAGPGRRKDELHVRMLHGRKRSLVGEGTGTIQGQTVRFQLRSAGLPGVAPLDVEGSWVRGKTVFRSVTSANLQPPAVAPAPRSRPRG
jgi:hypothetical protein